MKELVLSRMDVVASVAALLLFIVFVALDFTQRFHYGGGRHTWDLPPEYYNGYLTVSLILMERWPPCLADN